MRHASMPFGFSLGKQATRYVGAPEATIQSNDIEYVSNLFLFSRNKWGISLQDLRYLVFRTGFRDQYLEEQYFLNLKMK